MLKYSGNYSFNDYSYIICTFICISALAQKVQLSVDVTLYDTSFVIKRFAATSEEKK